MDDLPPADVRHPVTPNLEIAQILTEGEAFDDAADFGVYFLGCAKRRGTVDLGVPYGTCKNIDLQLTPFLAVRKIPMHHQKFANGENATQKSDYCLVSAH